MAFRKDYQGANSTSVQCRNTDGTGSNGSINNNVSLVQNLLLCQL